VSGGVRQPFHEAADSTLAGGAGRGWVFRFGLRVKVAGGWSGMGRLGGLGLVLRWPVSFDSG